MTDREFMPMGCEVPLVELLESVPKSARLFVDDEDGNGTSHYPVGHLCHKAAKALRDRLAQPDIESPASTTIKSELHRLHKENQALNKCLFQMQEAEKECSYPKCQATNGCVGACSNTAPPKREWVGLTDADIAKLRCQGAHSVSDRDFRAIEGWLREKNT